MKYVIIGPLPPPLGGISVYVDRRSRLLRKEGNSVFNVDFGKLGKLGRIAALARILFQPGRIFFELHSYDFSVMTALVARPFPKELRYMDHNTLLYGHNMSGLRRTILSRFMSRAHVQFVSAAGLQFYQSRGFSFPSSEVCTAYIPPPREDEQRILESYDTRTTDFLNSSWPLLVANASQIVFVNGTDLYGLDMCAKLLLMVRETYPEAGFLFALANDTTNREYVDQIRSVLKDGLAENHFHFLSGQRELWPVFKRADLFVRPTTGDGFAVSIAEALELGCPVLASDAVARPEGVVRFKNRDMSDFAGKALAMLQGAGRRARQ